MRKIKLNFKSTADENLRMCKKMMNDEFVWKQPTKVYSITSMWIVLSSIDLFYIFFFLLLMLEVRSKIISYRIISSSIKLDIFVLSVINHCRLDFYFVHWHNYFHPIKMKENMSMKTPSFFSRCHIIMMNGWKLLTALKKKIISLIVWVL